MRGRRTIARALSTAGFASASAGTRRNEDAAELSGRAVAVADGMGGLEAGDVAAQLATRNVLNVLDELMSTRVPGRLPRLRDPVRHVADCVADALGVANEAVRSLAEGIDAPAGSTIAVAVPYRNTLRGLDVCVAHIGDTVALVAQGHDVRLLTTPHTLARKAADSGSGTSGRGRNVLYRRLGTPRCLPDVAHVRLRRRGRLLLVTDGISNVLTYADVAHVAPLRPADAARELVELAMRAGSTDDCTAAVFDWRPRTRGRRLSMSPVGPISTWPVLQAAVRGVTPRLDRASSVRTTPLEELADTARSAYDVTYLEGEPR